MGDPNAVQIDLFEAYDILRNAQASWPKRGGQCRGLGKAMDKALVAAALAPPKSFIDTYVPMYGRGQGKKDELPLGGKTGPSLSTGPGHNLRAPSTGNVPISPFEMQQEPSEQEREWYFHGLRGKSRRR